MIKRHLTLVIFMVCDIISAVLSLGISLIITGNDFWGHILGIYGFAYIIFSASILLTFYIFKIYNILWRYSSFAEFLRIPLASVVSIFILVISQEAVKNSRFDLSVYFIAFLLVNCLVIIQRSSYKKIANKVFHLNKPIDDTITELTGNFMIIGAGSAGQMIINEMHRKKEYSKCKIRCVIDDDYYKHGHYISGIKIIGGRSMIIEAAEKLIRETDMRLDEILNQCGYNDKGNFIRKFKRQYSVPPMRYREIYRTGKG